jgi:hypothetical protein
MTKFLAHNSLVLTKIFDFPPRATPDPKITFHSTPPYAHLYILPPSLLLPATSTAA